MPPARRPGSWRTSSTTPSSATTSATRRDSPSWRQGPPMAPSKTTTTGCWICWVRRAGRGACPAACAPWRGRTGRQARPRSCSVSAVQCGPLARVCVPAQAQLGGCRAGGRGLTLRARADLPGLEAPGDAGKKAGKKAGKADTLETPADRPQKMPPVDLKYAPLPGRLTASAPFACRCARRSWCARSPRQLAVAVAAPATLARVCTTGCTAGCTTAPWCVRN